MSFGSETCEIVNPELFLDFHYFSDDVLKTALAEEVVLSFLELLAELFDILVRNNFVERREEHGILARFMWAIHANERSADTENRLP